jgi:serine/threonine-protein kinase
MSSDRRERALQVLAALFEERPADPSAWLAARCGDAPELRAEVEDLRAACDDGPIADEAVAVDWIPGLESEGDLGRLLPPGPVAGPDDGRRVGRYRLLEQVGAGGMGVVYRAERADGSFEQHVAVKMLRRRVASIDGERRFRAERQVLASLDHPNIARLIDGGVTENGRLYLVMEHVDGTPLTDYADARGLSTDDRVALLIQVARAVAAAHQRLVVHRDLKPSNVLVEETGGEPQVKLLDFGIAKLLSDDLPTPRPVTRTGHQLMTPAYAAPEQVTGGEVTTATDTYQLGTLAYELLARVPPFDLEGATRTEIERCVAETRPDAPSAAGASRGIDAQAVAGDLDTVVLKAMRKEPDRRYRSVDALRADLLRYRERKPVAARPATLHYRTRKFVRRHRWGVATATAALLVVAVFVGVLVRERNAAQREAAKAEQVSTFLVDLFQASDPHHAQGDTLRATALLARGKRRLGAIEDPAVQGQMAYVLGQTHRRLGDYEVARGLLERSAALRSGLHGLGHPASLESLSALALLQRDRGNYRAADTLLRQVVRGRTALHGPDDSTVVQARMYLGFVQRRLGRLRDAEASLRGALESYRTLTDEPDLLTAELLFNLASLLRNRSKLEAALPLQRRSLALVRRFTDGPHPGLVANLNNLALLQKERGAHAAAESLYRATLRNGTALYGREHPKRALWMMNFGSLHTERHRYAEADSLLTRALALGRASHEDPHPQVALALHNLAANHDGLGNAAAADSTYRKALAMMRTVHGSESARTAATAQHYAALLTRTGGYEDAERLLTESLQTLRAVRPEGHPDVGQTVLRLGRLRRAQGRLRDADSLARAAVSAFRRARGRSRKALHAADALQLRADVALDRGDLDAAEGFLETAGERLSAAPDSVVAWRRAVLKGKAGTLARRRGRLERADSLLTGSYAALRDWHASDTRFTRAARERLVALCEARGQTERARRLRDHARAYSSASEAP